MRFDLLIKGGEVIDPGGAGGRRDVAVAGGRIAAVDANIPADTAAEVVEVGGCLVTPGLVDLHTHVYRGATFYGIDPDPVAWHSGVTTWVDAGSSGAFTFPGLRDFVAATASVRVLAMLHLSAIGLVAKTGESSNLAYLDQDLCARIVQRDRDLVVGVKVRIDGNATGGNGPEALRRARWVADRCEVPLMVHIGVAPVAAGRPTLGISEVLASMREGDVLTHCMTRQSIRLAEVVGGRWHASGAAARARAEGIVLDVGHGAGSFSFEVAEALLEAGLPPDVISTDLHQHSVLGPVFDLPTCLSKFLSLGMSLPEVIRAATRRPAEAIGRFPELGSLRPGARADVAVFASEDGRFQFEDVHGERRIGRQRLRNTHTFVGGSLLPPSSPEAPAPWVEAPWIDLSERQRSRRDELLGTAAQPMSADLVQSSDRRRQSP